MIMPPYLRARRVLWTLVLLAILLVGALNRAVQAPPDPRTGAAVAILGIFTVIVLALAARLLLALTGRLAPRNRRTDLRGD
jgi:HAMP domain-containing protein